MASLESTLPEEAVFGFSTSRHGPIRAEDFESWPVNPVVYTDLVIRCVEEAPYLPGTETVGRVPELVIELLSPATAGRDRAPAGVKLRFVPAAVG